MDAFRQRRTFDRATRLSVSLLTCPGRHTVSNLLCTCGRQFLDWSADYRLFSQDAWETPPLFSPIVRGVLDLLPATAPFVSALDDTHLKKTGTHIPGVAYRRDPLSPPFHTNLIRAQRFIQLSSLLFQEEGAGPARAIPIRYEHAPPVPKPKRWDGPEVWKAYREQIRQKNLSTQAVALLRETRTELDRVPGAEGRSFLVAVDGSYTNQTVIRGLPPRTTLIGRIRKDAELFFPPQPEDQAAVGTKCKYGKLAPTPEALRQDPEVPWQEVPAFGAGRMHPFRTKTLGPVLWKKAGPNRSLRLVVIAPVGYRLRQGSKLLYRQPAHLICTDPNLPVEKIVQYYLWRWDIEVNHRDEKQIIGVGQAQVRSAKAVDRLPAFAVASYAMLLLASVRAFGRGTTAELFPPPKWYPHPAKPRLSTQDLIHQLRKEVWSAGLNPGAGDSNPFVSETLASTKGPEFQLPLTSAVLYAQTG